MRYSLQSMFGTYTVSAEDAERYGTGMPKPVVDTSLDRNGEHIAFRQDGTIVEPRVRGRSFPRYYIGEARGTFRTNDTSLDEQHAFRLFTREEMMADTYVSEIDTLDDVSVPDYVKRDEYLRLVERYRPEAKALHIAALLDGKASSERAHLRTLVSAAIERLQDAPETEPHVWALADRVKASYNETLTNALAMRTLNYWLTSNGEQRIGSMVLTHTAHAITAQCVKCDVQSAVTDAMMYDYPEYNREMMQVFTAWALAHGTNHASQYAGTGANRIKVDRGLIGKPLPTDTHAFDDGYDAIVDKVNDELDTWFGTPSVRDPQWSYLWA